MSEIETETGVNTQLNNVPIKFYYLSEEQMKELEEKTEVLCD